MRRNTELRKCPKGTISDRENIMLEMKDSLDTIRGYRRSDVGRDSSWCTKCACIQHFNHIKWKHQDMSDAKKV